MNHAMPLDSALTDESQGYNPHPKMAFAAGAMTGMPDMRSRFIDDLQALRLQCPGKGGLNQATKRGIIPRHGAV